MSVDTLINEMSKENTNVSTIDLSRSFSRRQLEIVNSLIDSSTLHTVVCHHCGTHFCRNNFIHSWLVKHSTPNQQQYIIDQRIEELISIRLPTLMPKNMCEERLLNWYNLMKRRQSTMASRTTFSIRSLLLFSFPTQNRAGFYQLCSNGHQIIIDDCCQTHESHRLPQSIRCLRLYNHDEEEYTFELPELKETVLLHSIQNITWNQFYKIFIFITNQRIFQCQLDNRMIKEISEYKLPSLKHSLALITSDQHSSIFLAYEYPSATIELWNISEIGTWSFKKRWTPVELFPLSRCGDDDDIEEYEQESCVYSISSMRYSNGTLHLLTRHERHWCLYIVSVVIDQEYQKLILQRRIDISLDHLRFAGENFQMEILPNEQGWLLAVRREYLIHLAWDGKHAKKVLLPSSRNCANSIYNVCIMHGEVNQHENDKYLVVRDINSIRFYTF